MAKDNFFNRLTRLFRSGPALQRRIKGQDYKASYDKALSNSNLGFRGHAGFGKESSPFSALGAYGILDRMARYSTFSTMEQTAEISTCLDIFADEICASDDKGRCLSVYSENPEIKAAVEELFIDTINVDFNLRPWSRNMSKYGDFFLFVEVVPDVGVISCTPIPVNELERDEGFDPQDPSAVRFKWLTRGNKILENWQVIHIRILGNDMMLPYGTSVLDGARRVHSQLCHAPGTRVLTTNGYKNIENIADCDFVYTHLPDSKQTVSGKVKHLVNMGKQQLVSVETHHRTIKVTPNHGLLIKDKDGKFSYKKARDLKFSEGKGGWSNQSADCLVLPVVTSGKSELSVNFNELSQNYAIQLDGPTSDIDRVGILDRLKQIKTSVGYKHVHGFLQGKKRLSLPDFQLVQKELSLTTSHKYYFKHSKKQSRFFNPGSQEHLFDVDFIKFFGFMLGDGWVNKKSFGFALGNHEEQNKHYIDLATKLFGNDYHYDRKKGTFSAQVNWSNSEVATILSYFDFRTGFAKKIIPTWAYELNQTCRIALLRGLFDADGCDSNNIITLANKGLIQQTQELCWMSGVNVGKKISVNLEKPGHKESYSIRMNLEKITENVAYEPVIRITSQEMDDTWDLEVEHSEHNFLANGIVTHNTLMEDAMLTYRVVRSPERRVFYIDVGNTAPNDVPSFMEAAKAGMSSNTLVDRQNGRTDQRHNPISILEDYYIPIRGETGGTKIETLAGGQHVSATEDVEYLQKKLFAALKVPRAYFGYDEGVGSKATLASEDVKFSRTISVLQKIIIAEFNKLAILHLYSKGFDGEDLVNFELFLTNPSSIAVQQKLALWNDRMDIATKAKELGLVGEEWIQEEILGFTPEDISKAKNARKENVLFAKELEAIAVSDENQEHQATVDPFDPSNYQVPGADVEKNHTSGQSGVTDSELVKGIAKFDQDGQIMKSETAPGVSPVKATPYATRMRRNDKRQVGQGGIGNLGMPNFKKMLDFSGKHQYNTDIYDIDFVNRKNEQVEMEKSLRKSVEVPKSIRKMLDEMDRSIGKSKAKLLTEAFEKQEKEKDTSDKLSLLLEEAFPENAGLLTEGNIPEKDTMEGEEDLETSEIIKDLEKDD